MARHLAGRGDISLLLIDEEGSEGFSDLPCERYHLPRPMGRLGKFILPNLLLPRALSERIGAELLHVVTPYGCAFPTLPVPQVVTIHDLSPLTFPQGSSWMQRAHFHRLLPLILRRSRAIVTHTTRVAGALSRRFPGIGGRVHVIPPGIPSLPIPAGAVPAGRPFALHVGTTEPRKGLEILLDAFREFPLDLYLVGEILDRAELEREIERRGLGGRVRLLGFLPDAQLARLYRAATFLVVASRCEGFGFPPLEAMRAGLPVVASPASAALREVLGPAVLWAPGSDAAALQEGMRRMLQSRETREHFIAAGKAWADRYGWERFCDRIERLYHAVVSGPPRGQRSSAPMRLSQRPDAPQKETPRKREIGTA